VRQVHRLGGGRRLVEERGVRDLEPREVGDHRLEREQGLEPSLRDLGLVRRVRGVPARVLEDVPQDDGRRERVVVPHPEIRTEHLVPRGQRRQLGQGIPLGSGRGEGERPAEADLRRDDGGLEHRPHVFGARSDVAFDEGVDGAHGPTCCA
jgi:hypothetical protein